MKRIFFLLLIIYMVNSKMPNSSKFKSYKISDIIDLIKQINTKGYKIIDPDDYIKGEDEVKLEKQLKKIYKGHKIISFIIVIRSAYLKEENGEEIDLSNYVESLLEEIKILHP